jgi:Lipocalin-like domain
MKSVPLFIAMFVAAIGASEGFASAMLKPDVALVGTWRLISYIDTETGSEPVRAFGNAPVGQFVFTADGHAAISIMRNPPAPKQSTSDIDPDASIPAWYCSYFGTYRVDPDGHGWTLHVEGANIPSFIGTEQHRTFEIDGRHMIISETYQADGKTVRAERVLERTR